MVAQAEIIKNPFFEFDGVDFSAQVREITLPFSLDEVESTASGDGTHVFLPGLENFTMEIKALKNYGAGSLDEKLWATKGTVVTAKFKRKNAAKGVANPEYSAQMFASEMNILSGAIGDADEIEITLTANGPLQRDATS